MVELGQFGYNPNGAFGNGTKTSTSYYIKRLGEYGNGIFENSMLQAMTNATGLVSDNMGRVYTAGYNGYGEIGDNSNTQSTVLVGISHTSLSVEETTIKMDVGETKEIKAHMELGFNLLYKTLENETYTYKSVNEKIATVDDKGVVTGVKYGKTSIIVTNKETGERE